MTKTILLSEAKFEDCKTKIKLANSFPDDFRIILIIFPKKELLMKYVKNDNIKLFSVSDIAKNRKDLKEMGEKEILKKLRDIEKKINYPIQKIFFADPEFWKIYLKNPLEAYKDFITYFEIYKQIIEDNKIDLFWTIAPDRFNNLLPYFICKLKNIRTILSFLIPYSGYKIENDLISYKIENDLISREDINTTKDKAIGFREYVDKVTSEKGSVFDEFFRKEKKTVFSDILLDNFKKMKKLILFLYKNLIYFPYIIFNDNNHPYRYISIDQINFILRTPRAILTKLLLKILRRYNKIVKNEKYFFYPLHYTEDSQVRLFAPEYYNQFELIKAIAKQLPIDTYLYIKEHPQFKGCYPIKDLLSISKIRNVKLLDPNINSKSIIKSAIGVITLNSSAGYEALFCKKPVFCFSKSFYASFPGVTELKNINELYGFLDDSDYLRKMTEEIEKNLEKVVYKMLASSYNIYVWGTTNQFIEKENIQKIINMLNEQLIGKNENHIQK